MWKTVSLFEQWTKYVTATAKKNFLPYLKKDINTNAKNMSKYSHAAKTWT